MDDPREDALQCTPKLHSIPGGEEHCIRIDVGKRVVHDQTWAPIALRNDPERGDAETGPVGHDVVRQHDPVPLPAEVNHLFTYELSLTEGRFMRASGGGGIPASLLPRGGRHRYASAALAEVMKKACGAVGEVTNSPTYIGAPTLPYHSLLPS